MSIKTRIAAIRKSRRTRQPWLIITCLIPTADELEQIATAEATGRFCVCFNPLTAEAWIPGSITGPWWEEENVIN